jgi:3-isopropylmalate/(R)-2-methylmalate dehydratase large subunit
MQGKTFAEKILGAPAGSIVFKKPDIVLTHDNTYAIQHIYKKMGGGRIHDPGRLMVVLANSYQEIRHFVEENRIGIFFDAGNGICHQLMADYARPGMILVGSDSHTCTAGAFNAFAVGIDRTEAAGIWKTGETWFRVPESFRITLKGVFRKGVGAKDLALYIMGRVGAGGADYLSMEFSGEGLEKLTVSDRMVLANMASEVGAKNAVFPCDKQLEAYFEGRTTEPVWADPGARYVKELEIDLSELTPMVAYPHQVDNVCSIGEIGEVEVQQALIGTCTNGRLEDLRVAAAILEGKHVPFGFQLLIIPASREIYKQALKEGIIEIFLNAGGNILSPSCGPCLGTGQGIPADGVNVISTANRNFLGRMGNKNADIYLASPVTVAWSAWKGKIVNPEAEKQKYRIEKPEKKKSKGEISENENRYDNGVWDYSDIHNLNTDLMFAGNLTYEVNSSEPAKIKPHLFKTFDPSFADKVHPGDILVCGDNFGCGSSREHPAVGLAYAGVKAVIVRSVNRIFYRSAINQGLPVIVSPEAVTWYRKGNRVDVDLRKGVLKIEEREFPMNPLPDKLLDILSKGGLVRWMMEK